MKNMGKRLGLITGCLLFPVFLAGCATTSSPDAQSMAVIPQEERSETVRAGENNSLGRVIKGMTRDEVSFLLLRELTIGFEIDPQSGEMKELKAQSLFSSDTVVVDEDVYDVDYYITVSPEAGRPVTSEQLVPMVFKDGFLVAKSQEELQVLKNRVVPAQEQQ